MKPRRSMARPASSGVCTSAPKTRSPKAAALDVADHQLDAERRRARLQHVDGLRVARVGDEELRRADHPGNPLGLRAVQHRHRLGGGGGLVEQRSVGHFHAGQVRDHRLEVEERFEAPLRDFGLIRRVGRVPARVLEHVADDHARRDGVVVAEADVGAEPAVLRGGLPKLAEEVVFALARRERERLLQPDARGNRFVHERVERRRADGLQHLPALGLVGTDVPGLEVLVIENHDCVRGCGGTCAI